MRGRALRLGPALVALAAALAHAPAPAADETQVQIGRRIFLEGRNARGEPIRALLGVQGGAISGGAVACGNCHGADGRGRPEGGVRPSDITWENLTKPYGLARSDGSRHGPYDERSFARAVTEGVDPGGRPLGAAMPRYSLSVSESTALTEYLKRLAEERDPGVGDALLRLGTILPDRGPAAAVGAAMRAVLNAYVAELNAQGGIHGRKIELVVAEDIAQAEARFAETPVFALVSPYAVGSEASLARLTAERRLDVIAPFSLWTAADGSAQTFYLYSGISDLARVLLDFARRNSDLKSLRLAAFVAEPEGRVARALQSECRRQPCGGLEILPTGAATDPGAAARLKLSGVQAIVFTGNDAELAALLDYAERQGWHPAIYVPGGGAVRAMYAAPQGFEGKLFIAYPTRSELQSGSPAASAFERLRTEGSLGTRHAAAQGFAYAALSIAAEGLRRAGRDVSRERFERALEGLYRFDAGPTPPVSFGPGRRVGTLGGYVLAVDPRRGFRAVSDWIDVEPL